MKGGLWGGALALCLVARPASGPAQDLVHSRTCCWDRPQGESRVSRPVETLPSSMGGLEVGAGGGIGWMGLICDKQIGVQMQ